ncbi:unnamed protein product (mitochondrion) [Plasmodiophora brassicae]|uniref:MORN repeat-containing protein 5 n=1 Tax=Plasmodiophora brassicae TaxID=37360 RepID=A0A0G4J0R2_PLABS|nr:hypothetical protein PBRA_008261 [Plasmodiophora brassicae]SPR00954.1 unnamed protein product [Plasmodiophora brassicae]
MGSTGLGSARGCDEVRIVLIFESARASGGPLMSSEPRDDEVLLTLPDELEGGGGGAGKDDGSAVGASSDLVVFDDGDLFFGEVDNGEPVHGCFARGGDSIETYVGDFDGEKRHGFGCHTYPNGDRYFGEWEHGRRNGNGTYLFADGLRSYTGQWVDNSMSGHGTFTFADGRKYCGGWLNNRKHGNGLIMKGGVAYQVVYKDGNLASRPAPCRKVSKAAKPGKGAGVRRQRRVQARPATPSVINSVIRSLSSLFGRRRRVA